MKRRHIILPLLTATLALPASGANILFDDFESYTVGSNIHDQTNWNADNRAGNVTTQNTNFGTSNKYAEIKDTSGTGFSSMVHKTKIESGQTVTFSLDFIASNDQGINFGFATSTAENQVLGSTNRAFSTSLTNGSIGGTNATGGFGSGFFALNAAYELKMVLNDSGATVNYAGRTLVDNSYDVWIRDLTVSGSTYVGTGTFDTVAGGYYSAARSFNGPTPTYYIDNWLVEEGAIVSPIPEPRAALLGGLGLLALLRRRRA